MAEALVTTVRVLVTGATGFLGSHILEQLLSAGHDVRALVRSPVQRDGVDFVRGDVTDPASLRPAMEGREAVIHSAAVVTFKSREAARQREVNVQGTRNVVEAARAAGVSRLVFTSSVAAIGRPNGAPADETTRYDWPVGLTYNETKRDAEEIVRQARDLETICLNPALVLGPRERYHHSLPLFRLAKWGLLQIVPAGGATLCDVRDVAAAHVAALTRGRSGERYVLGGPQLTFAELARELAAATGGRPARAEIPSLLLRFGALPLVVAERLGVPMPYSPLYAPYLTLRSFYKSDRAVADLGYCTRPAAETIGDAAAWYRAEGLL
jgi:nucleoside-diphosphate-sugar epimerase